MKKKEKFLCLRLSKPYNNSGVLSTGKGAQAKPVLKWIRENLGPWPRVNIMGQYFPAWKAYLFPETGRRLGREEYRDVIDYAGEIGLKNFIVQEQYLR